MSRLSIEVTPEQHQRLKAIAAVHGQTVKDYILERTLPYLPESESLSEQEALERLDAFLHTRIPEAERGKVVEDSVEQIFAAVRDDLDRVRLPSDGRALSRPAIRSGRGAS